MKIKIEEPKKLIEAIRLLNIATTYPTDNPRVLVSCREGTVRMATCSSGCQVTCKIAGQADRGEPGKIIVDRETLSKLHLWGKSVSIGVEKEHLLVSSGHSRYSIPACKGSSIELEKVEAEAPANIDAGVIVDAMHSVWFGHADGGTGDIRLIIGGGTLKVETADVFRAALNVRTVPGWKKVEPYQITLSRKVAEAVFGAFEKDTAVAISLKEGRAVVMGATATVVVPCILVTTMPQVEKQIDVLVKSVKSTASCTIDLDDVKNTIKGALAVLTKQKSEKDDVAMTFTIGPGGLTTKVHGDRGKYATEIRASNIKGKTVFSTAPRYLKVMVGLAAREKCDVTLDVLGEKVVMLSLADKNVTSKYAFVQLKI